MADKYIAVNRTSGGFDEVEAITSSAGSSDAGKVIATKADGTIDESFLPSGVGAEVKVVPATEDMTAPCGVNIYNSSGEKCRKSDATGASPKPCHGYILASVANGNNATVYLDGNITGLSGLTPGLPIFTGKTAGAFVQDVSEYTTDDLFQDVGVATATDSARFNYSKPVKLA